MSRVERASDATLFVFVGAQRVECAVRAGRHWVPESQTEIGVVGVGPDGGIGMVCAALAQAQLALEVWRDAWPHCKVAHVRVLVAETWLALAPVPWSGALKNADAGNAFARAQLKQAGLEVQSADLLRLDDAAFAQPRLAVAYPASLLAALQQLADRFGAQLGSVLPLGMVAWSVARRPTGLGLNVLAVADRGMLLMLQGAGRIEAVTLRPGERRALPDLWGRMRLRDQRLARQDRLALLDLDSVDATDVAEGVGEEFTEIELPRQTDANPVSPRLHLAALSQSCRLAIDAVAARPAMTPMRWAVALIAVTLTGGLMTETWRTTLQVRLLKQQLAAAQDLPHATVAPAVWSREERARAQAVNAAIRELNLPVAALLQALRPPRDIHVAVLGVDVLGVASGSTNGIKITGAARTGVEMARYVSFVASRKPFTGAYLTHHEIDEASAERAYRFTVEAAWSD